MNSSTNTVFTLETLICCSTTQEAVKAMLELARYIYRPKGACRLYNRLVEQALRTKTEEEFTSTVMDVAASHLIMFDEFLWNLENKALEDVDAGYDDDDDDDDTWHNVDEDHYAECAVPVLWRFLLNDFVDDNGLASVPDLGYMVNLEGKTFQEHSIEVGAEFYYGKVLKFRSMIGGWMETSGEAWPDSDYYCMAVPVENGLPLWHKWCFFPHVAQAEVVKYADICSGTSKYEDWADEPPIRTPVMTKSKCFSHKGEKYV